MPTGFGGGGGKVQLAFYTDGFSTQATGRSAANQVAIQGLVIPYAVSFSKIGISIAAGDAVNNYDVGLYTSAGVLVANIGAQTLPATGQQQFNTVQGSQIIQPGLYVFAWTGNANTATLNFYPSGVCWVNNQGYVASAGGALPASITAPAIAAAQFRYQVWLL